LHLVRVAMSGAVDGELREPLAAAPVADLLDVPERAARLIELEARRRDGLLVSTAVLQVRMFGERARRLERQVQELRLERLQRLVRDGLRRGRVGGGGLRERKDGGRRREGREEEDDGVHGGECGRVVCGAREDRIKKSLRRAGPSCTAQRVA